MSAQKQTDPQFKLRMPQKLKDLLEQEVATSGRTLNAEIVWRLERTFAGSAVLINSDMRKRIELVAKGNKRDLQTELWHGLETLYPSTVDTDLHLVKQLWKGLVEAQPNEAMEEVTRNFRNVIMKSFPNGDELLKLLEVELGGADE